MDAPALHVWPLDDIEWEEVHHQIHPDGRTVRMRHKLIERLPTRTTMLTIYEAGLIRPRHTHFVDQFTHVIQGEFLSGKTLCKAPAVLFLEKGAEFGPVQSGPEGATILEIFLGPSAAERYFRDEFEQMLKDRGITEVKKQKATS